MTTEIPRKSTSAESGPHYPLRRTVAAVLAGAAVFGAAEGIKTVVDKGFRYHQVGSPVTEGIDKGGINTVQIAATELAKENHISPTDIGNIVGAGQEVEGELQQKYGETFLQPGQQIVVRLEKKDWGGYKVEADPAGQDSAQ